MATKLKALTGEQGLNVAYDPVGGDKAEPAFRSLALAEHDSSSSGFAAGEIPKIPLNLTLLKRSAIVGVDWGGEMRANPAINQNLMTTLMQWISDGKLKPAPVQSRPMSDYQHGLIDQLAGRIVGKLVLTNA